MLKTIITHIQLFQSILVHFGLFSAIRRHSHPFQPIRMAPNRFSRLAAIHRFAFIPNHSRPFCHSEWLRMSFSPLVILYSSTLMKWTRKDWGIGTSENEISILYRTFHIFFLKIHLHKHMQNLKKNLGHPMAHKDLRVNTCLSGRSNWENNVVTSSSKDNDRSIDYLQSQYKSSLVSSCIDIEL
jgi:hypothetical protein